MSRSSYTTCHIETEFGHLAVHYKGNIHSNRAFVFLHGHIDSSMENVSHNVFNNHDDELKILLDLRSHGSSIRTLTYPSLSDRCEDIDIFIEKIKEKFTNIRKFNFIGWSQGASTILYYLLSNYKGKYELGDTYLFAPRLDLKSYLEWFNKEIQHITETGDEIFKKKYGSKGILNFHRNFITEFSTINFYDMISILDKNAVLMRGDLDYLLQRDEVEKLVNLNPRFLKYVELANFEHTPRADQFELLFDLIVEMTNQSELETVQESSNILTQIISAQLLQPESISILAQ